MSHYHKDVVFRSLKTQSLFGRGELIGRHELRRYWAKALERQPALKLQVQEVFQGYQMMTLSYRNQNNVFATEIVYFNAEGLVFRAATCHQTSQREAYNRRASEQ